MNTPPRSFVFVAIAALAFGLVACSSGSDGCMQRDHSAHESGAGMHDEHAGHGPGGAAMGMEHEPDSDMNMREFDPAPDHPLRTCVVTGEPLGGMGDVIAFGADGQEVQLCCADCVDEFKESQSVNFAETREPGAR